MHRISRVGLAALSTLVGASAVAAQTSVFVQGGVTAPIGDYSDLAAEGWMAQGGALFSFSPVLAVGGSVFYGVNDHDPAPDGDETNLYGGLAFLEYTLATTATAPYMFGGIGFLTHAYRSDTFPDESESGLALTVGTGVNFPLGDATGFAEVQYLTGLGNGVGGTDLFFAGAGLAFTLGG
jgi:hypothetical protein